MWVQKREGSNRHIAYTHTYMPQVHMQLRCNCQLHVLVVLFFISLQFMDLYEARRPEHVSESSAIFVFFLFFHSVLLQLTVFRCWTQWSQSEPINAFPCSFPSKIQMPILIMVMKTQLVLFSLAIRTCFRLPAQGIVVILGIGIRICAAVSNSPYYD